MTLLEELALTTLTEVLQHFEAGKISRVDFQEMMGHVRSTLKHFELLRLGCPTGTHLIECSCKPPIVGQTIRNLKRRREQGL